LVYYSLQPRWWETIDMADALHPQTLLVYGMNGEELPMGHGGPLRLRVARQLGYKSVKFIHRFIVTDSLKQFRKGGSYSWYAGI
jgi:DMSO/TMAO reductase YedYZ molybdopterin-dependent catalytic subunit